ncbi:MAG: tRNA (adenosine(37)-N6)-dimethylallyltransferase MiaA, partial [Clostridia bacterium]|nr:tRNA (adenosine(37)-N6)-dimethylallyltransferase MiaA [Clostridia bacterium]
MMSNTPFATPWLAIAGPTASGKTIMGVELALRHHGEVVSADSMQLYRGMDIGTAKPTVEEMRGVPHHMLSVADPWENYSAARYVREASACVDDIISRGGLPILVGGTGLYIDALVSGRPFAAFSGTVRTQLEERAKTEGVGALWDELRRVDPHRADRLPLHDTKRILRALEVWYETGTTISDHDAYTRTLPPRYDALYFGLSYGSRADLWARIDRRVEEMAASGLAGEVELDECYVGGKEEGRTGRGAEKKQIVIGGVELVRWQEPKSGRLRVRCGRIRLEVAPDVSGRTLKKFAHSHIARGATVLTDGWRGYSFLPRTGYKHVIVDAEERDQNLPHFHRVVSNLKTWLMGT